MRVLVVDDEPDVLDLYGRILRRAGLDVVLASGASDARLAAEQQEFDVMLCDVDMPGTRGPELAIELTGRHPSLRVVLISGSMTPVPARFRLLQKPVSAPELVSAVRLGPV